MIHGRGTGIGVEHRKHRCLTNGHSDLQDPRRPHVTLGCVSFILPMKLTIWGVSAHGVSLITFEELQCLFNDIWGSFMFCAQGSRSGRCVHRYYFLPSNFISKTAKRIQIKFDINESTFKFVKEI